MKVILVCAVVMFAFFAYIFTSMVHQAERVNDAADAIVARYAR